MGHIEFVDLQHELKTKNIKWYVPACCNPGASSCWMLRAQMRGKFSFDRQGVRVEDSDHDAKCLDLLRRAAQVPYDLVLFPEYCISYSVLRQVIKDKHLQPKNRKLWVLPCQGIPTDEFDWFMQEISADKSICVLDRAWTSPEVNRRSFVTAFFYVFVGYRNGQPVLCLVPQLKTQPMGDPDCLCEQAGMTTGSVIFTLERRLLTLLCADSMHNEITWQALQNEELLMSGLTILHPQLNSHPKDAVFSRLRWELFEHGEPGVYITSNWAGGTELWRKGDRSKVFDTIKLSWSCIYRKHADDVFEQWQGKSAQSRRQENEKWNLFGALMRPKRTEVWFSLNQEEALELNIPMLSFQGYGKTQVRDICAQARWCYDPGRKSWQAWTRTPQTLQQRIEAACPKGDLLRDYSEKIPDPYRFPLDTEEKLDSDQFFALALANFHNSVLEIDEDENLSAWTLLLDESERETAVYALDLLARLIGVFREELPAHCGPLKNNPSFCYRPAQAGSPSLNLQAEGQAALVAYAQNAMDAQRHVKFLRQTQCHEDDDLVRQFVRVFTYEPFDRKLICEPQPSTDITQGAGVVMKGDIANGGTETDP